MTPPPARPLDRLQIECLSRLAQALVDQHRGRVAVAPYGSESGFWFGGGNLVEAPDGTIYLVGRYRNPGDSRTGLTAGARGLELAIFRSDDSGRTFHKQLQFSKQDLATGEEPVLSIEGSALHWTTDGPPGAVELFVSTEKAGRPYPDGLQSYLKPHTGVWTIEHLRADSIEQLDESRPTTILESHAPQFLHVKDPVVYDDADGDLVLLFCSHPFCWTSSNSGYMVRRRGETAFQPAVFDFFRRGFAWDVAMTAVLDIPPVGRFRDHRTSLVFYDGGECVRNLAEHEAAVRRPRGYSCEELGGVAYFTDGRLDDMHRISELLPLLISPHGTGCSRYVDVLATREGMIATWQQAQPDGSQPLVSNFLTAERIEGILSE